ncbi:uncharacterized protein [Macrobrachium rosenbergii]|uniref:uncharacterized protein n=1 Tax=Macrobrachium rosenbergii TaxID=79674 RepID=UPI0034D39277
MAPLTEALRGQPKSLAWGPSQQQAFSLTKAALAEATALAHQDPTTPLQLMMDTSSVTCGAILEQIVDGAPQPIAFLARSSTPQTPATAPSTGNSARTTAKLLTEKFVWHGMRKDARTWARQCPQCQTSKVGRHTKSGVGELPQLGRRFGHIHIDIVGPHPPSGGARYILTVVDCSTRWSEATPMQEATASGCAEALLSSWISRFGVPDHITTELWSSLARLLGTAHHTTTAYNLTANGLVKRFHRSLKASLMTRCTAEDWKYQLSWVLLGLRTAPRADGNIYTAEKIYGEPLVVPGELVTEDRHNPSVQRLRDLVGKFASCKRTYTDRSVAFTPPGLSSTTHVFVRDDAIRPPLLALHGKNNWVLVDHIKPALLEEDTDVTALHPPPEQSSLQPAPHRKRTHGHPQKHPPHPQPAAAPHSTFPRCFHVAAPPFRSPADTPGYREGGRPCRPGPSKIVKEQIAEKRKYEEAQRQHKAERRREDEEREERRRQQEAEQWREEEEREEWRRQHELAFKDRELELERAKKESAEALAAQQASSPTPSALNTSLSTVSNLAGKWTEDEPEQWLEEIEFLFETYDVSLAERAFLLFTKHLDRKAKAAHRALERDQRGDMAAIREAIAKAYEITPERWRQQFRGMAKNVGWSWTEWACHKTQAGTHWFESMRCGTFEDLFNQTMLEDLFQCAPGPLAVCLSDKQPATLKEACCLADAWEMYNPSHSTLQRKLVPPGHLSAFNRPRNGPPNKPPCTIRKKHGHNEAECRYRDNNQQGNNPWQPTSNRQSSSPPNSTQSSQHTVTAGRSTYPRDPSRDCGASGHSSSAYLACLKHVVAPRHVNISATASLAELPERTHPERVWTQSVSVASLDGSSPPVHLPTTANTGSDISLIDWAQVPASAKVDEHTK